jgi:hypothetical protein
MNWQIFLNLKLCEMNEQSIKQRLEEIRVELSNENISYGELTELQYLAKYIDADDTELLEAAGIPEFQVTSDEIKARLLKRHDWSHYDMYGIAESECDVLSKHINLILYRSRTLAAVYNEDNPVIDLAIFYIHAIEKAGNLYKYISNHKLNEEWDLILDESFPSCFESWNEKEETYILTEEFSACIKGMKERIYNVRVPCNLFT